MNDTKVKFADYDDMSQLGRPVEPEVLSLLERRRLDDLLSHPIPSVLDALSTHSVSLYDLGIRAGMDWRRRSNQDVTNHANNESYEEYERMSARLRNLKPHTSDCKHMSYLEGWLAGWHSIVQLEGQPNYNAREQAANRASHTSHVVNRGAY